MRIADLARLRQLEVESKKLKSPAAHLTLDKQMRQEGSQKASSNHLTGNLHPQEKITSSSFVAIQNAPFVAIQPHGIKPPFYACGHHPLLISLAQAVGIGQPFYKIDAYALLEKRLATGYRIDMRIEEMAGYFLPEMLASQRSGPYYLGGGCEGALIAFEIAQRLESLGHKIAMLVIWDTPIGNYWRNATAAYASIRRFSRLFSDRRLEIRRRSRHLLNKAKGILAGADRSSHRMYITKVLMRSGRNYVAKSYQGHIILFRASESAFECSDPTWGWGGLARQGVDLHVLSGNHITYFEQNFANFAEMLKISLAQAQTRAQCEAS